MKTFGCIGEHLGHSYSEEVHREIGGYRYALREVAPDALAAFFAAPPFDGFNVTIPYKERVLPYLSGLSREAARIGAVNTVVRGGDGRWYGHNTDYAGLLALAAHAGVSLSGKKVLILGTGGTAKTAALLSRDAGARETVLVSRTGKGGAATYDEAYRLHGDAEVLINATPQGMFPGDGTVAADPARFPSLCGVLDAVYHPFRTELVLRARERGIPAEGGLYMLVAQAVASSRLFTGETYPEDTVERVYRAVLSARRNLVLIGMPGSGKTTAGRCLAGMTGRPFFDTDEAFRAAHGVTPEEAIRKEGEAAFRDQEAVVVAQMAKESGAVIAVGGGAVLREENVRALRRNGVLLFLDRSPSFLAPEKDHPLSDTAEKLASLYEARRPRYLAVADGVLQTDADAETTAALLLRKSAEIG